MHSVVHIVDSQSESKVAKSPVTRRVFNGFCFNKRLCQYTDERLPKNLPYVYLLTNGGNCTLNKPAQNMLKN